MYIVSAKGTSSYLCTIHVRYKSDVSYEKIYYSN
jgi:hypothetical protein